MYEKLRNSYNAGKKSVVIWMLVSFVLCAGSLLNLIFDPSGTSFFVAASYLFGVIGCFMMLIGIVAIISLRMQKNRAVLWERIMDAPRDSKLAGMYIGYQAICRELKENTEAVAILSAAKEELICKIEKEAKHPTTP